MRRPRMLDPWLSLDAWAEEARDDIPHVRTIRFLLYYVHIGLVLCYLALSGFVLLFSSLVPFQESTGECLELRFPLSYIIGIYDAVNCCEEISYLIWYGHYWHYLYRWQNPRRWIVRAVNGAFFSTFMSELACAYNLPTVIMTSIFYLGGITSFLHYQKQVSYEYACRSLKSYLKHRHDPRHHYVPKYETPKSELYIAWFKVFIPILPSLFQLWWIYIDNGGILVGSLTQPVTWRLFWVYGFATIQAAGILAIPFWIYSRRNNATVLFVSFLIGEIATLLLFLTCDIGIALSYVLVTRYP